MMAKTAELLLLRDKLRRYLFTGGAASGMRGGLSLSGGSRTERWNLCATSAKLIVCNCKRDEGRPFGVGMRVQASNCPKRLRSKAPVVSVGEKAQLCVRWGPRR